MCAARPPRKGADERVVMHTEIDRVGAQCEVLAICLRTGLRQDALELAILREELDALANETERATALSVHDGIAQQQHRLEPRIDERGVARRKNLRTGDLHGA